MNKNKFFELDNGNNLIKIYLNKVLVFKKQVEFLTKIVNNSFQIKFLKNSFNICCKNVSGNIMTFINFNELKDNYEYNINKEYYIITLDIKNFLTIIKSIKDNYEVYIYIKEKYPNYLCFQIKDNYNQIQNMYINIYANKDTPYVISNEIHNDITLQLNFTQFKEYCSDLKSYSNQVSVNYDINNNILTFNASSNNIGIEKTIDEVNLKVRKNNTKNIDYINNIYDLENLCNINSCLCNVQNIFLSFYVKSINNVDINILIIDEILFDSDEYKYGRVKYLLTPYKKI